MSVSPTKFIRSFDKDMVSWIVITLLRGIVGFGVFT